ncbi:SipW-dependent-type signal peptide-containing protein [Candidatus Parcubacteria bacterium]|nr:SipW-dependent-type signal peptide-containing protein [Candidatus Parcubacteria bacterium]
MNKKIIVSLSVIAAVAAIAISGTVAYFSDTETSTGNTLTAGVIDIVVDGQNPWEANFSAELSDIKPCYTRYIEFTVRNLIYSNPIDLWKHIHITDQNDGYITEPECTEGGGTWDGTIGTCTGPDQTCCTGSYVPRNNLAAYIIYDMWVCNPVLYACSTEDNGEPDYDTGWDPIIEESQYVRLDNISSAWIYLGKLEPDAKMKVVQSYHLRSWPYAPEPEVTNWAQGDEMTFDIDLMATQENTPGPKGYFATLKMENKDPVSWEIISGDGIQGQLMYKTSGDEFDYSFSGVAPQGGVSYDLIYASDPWPQTGILIDSAVSDASGSISMSGVKDLGTDLPALYDINPGAKIWLVLSSDYTTDHMTGWNPSEYLFEEQYISYDDTNI